MDGAAIEDLGMTMEYSPSSRWEQSRILMMAQFGGPHEYRRVYGYPSIELRPGGGDESVTIHNVEEFVERTVDWALYRLLKSLIHILTGHF